MTPYLDSYIDFYVEFDDWDDLDFWSRHDGDHWVDYEYKRVVFPIRVQDLWQN